MSSTYGEIDHEIEATNGSTRTFRIGFTYTGSTPDRISGPSDNWEQGSGSEVDVIEIQDLATKEKIHPDNWEAVGFSESEMERVTEACDKFVCSLSDDRYEGREE